LTLVQDANNSVTHDDEMATVREDRRGEEELLDAEVIVVDRRYKIISPFKDYACHGDLLKDYSLYDYHSL